MPRRTKRQPSCYYVASDDAMPMRSRARLLLAIVIAVLALLPVVHPHRVHASEIHQLDAAWIRIADGSAQPTAAWSEFRERHPAEWPINQAEPETVRLDDRAWKAIVPINKRVNGAVSPREDMRHWGVADRSDYPYHGYRDCLDYQILNRRLLVEAGLPRRVLRLVVALDEPGQGHAVLPWRQTGYVYINSEGDRTDAWTRLRNQVAVTSAISR